MLQETSETGADRGADCDLAAARFGAGQEEIGNVDAGDEEHEGDGAEEDQHGPADGVNHVVLKAREDDGMVIGIEGMAGTGGGLRGVLHVARQFGLGLGKADAVAQTSEQVKAVAAAAAGAGRVDLYRDPKFGGVKLARGEDEAGGHDADNAAGCPVEADVAAQDAAVGAEGTLPEAVGKDGVARDARLVVVWGEGAAEEGFDAQEGHHAAADERGGGTDGVPWSRRD